MNCSPAATRALPFAVHVAFLMGATALAFIIEISGRNWAIESRWLYAVKSAGIAIALIVLWRFYTELRVFAFDKAAGLLGAIVGVAVFALWINLDFSWARIGELSGFDLRTDAGEIDWRWVGVRAFGAVILIPIAEELFWRSFLLRWLERRDFLSLAPAAIGNRALIISAAMFASAHQLWLAAFVAGLAYGWLYRHTGSLWTVIGAHALTNALLAAWVMYTQQWYWW